MRMGWGVGSLDVRMYSGRLLQSVEGNLLETNPKFQRCQAVRQNGASFSDYINAKSVADRSRV